MLVAYGKYMAKLGISHFVGTKRRTRSNASDSSTISRKHIENIIEELRNGAHQDSTKHTYHKVWTSFNKFLIRLDDIPSRWETRVSLFTAYLIKHEELKSSTVKTYISAIKAVLQRDDYQWDQEYFLLNSLTKACKLKNDKVKTRLPIQCGLLELILFQLQKHFRKRKQHFLELLYKAAFLLAYYGLLRVGEITQSQHSLKARDIHEGRDKNKMLIVLHSSKTHTRGDRPQKIRIEGKEFIQVTDPNAEDDKSSRRVEEINKHYFCPVQCVKNYIRARGEYEHDNDQFFIFKDGSPLKACHMRKTLRLMIKNLGLDPSIYDTHSFRIGRATDMNRLGYKLETIKYVGRWKSDTVLRYLR